MVHINVISYLVVLQHFFAKQAAEIDVGNVPVLQVDIADVA